MRLTMYLRVSSEGQVDGYGLDSQEAACRAWAKTNGHRVVEVCSDEGLSGTLDATERPGLACALATLVDGTADGVLIARLDRLARALHIQEGTLAVCWKAGGRVFAADSGEILANDPDDPLRKAIRQILGVIAELDRDMLTKRMRDGKRAKRTTGRKADGEYAFGYVGAGKGRERDAAPHAAEQVVVARIVQLRKAGRSYREIAGALDAEGLKPRRAAAWSAMSVRNVAVRELSTV